MIAETLARLRPRHLAEHRGAGRHAEGDRRRACMRSLAKVMAMPDVREQLLAAGIEPTISKSPEEFAAFIRAQAEMREQGDQGGRDEARLRRSAIRVVPP